jgi:hypothetical protein
MNVEVGELVPDPVSVRVAAGEGDFLYVNRAAGLPTVHLKDRAAYSAEQSSLYDPVLGVVYALLGLAIVIAVLGIINTVALS